MEKMPTMKEAVKGAEAIMKNDGKCSSGTGGSSMPGKK